VRRKAYVSEDFLLIPVGALLLPHREWGKDALAGSSVLRRRLHLVLSSKRGARWILLKMVLVYATLD
jgi:hypothetical protein